ncbi:MAG: hypothetical protein BWX78_00316 [Firmicutes bacterium ADurb.Bin099]|nr:MAG: hypothetical protein BWX78_00316 [Firmicutes bacterium ADurb.Bin099]
MKKSMAVLLIVTILSLTACNIGSEPAKESREGSFIYIVKDNEVTIIKYDGTEETVIIPDRISNKPVACIKDKAFSACSHVKEVFIPESVKRVGVCAFDDTEWYKSLKDEFVVVGDGVLIKCNQTSKDIVIPEGVKSLSSTFYKAGDGGFFDAVIYLPATLKKIDDYAFYKAFGHIIVCNTEQIEEIGQSAFEDSTVDRIIISDKLKSIKDRAFATTDKTVKRSMTIEMTGGGYYVGTQKKVKLPFATSLGKDIFYGLDGNMETVKFEDGTTAITKDMLTCLQSFAKFFIPGEVTCIEKDIFPEGAIIYTEAGSAAEKYAKDNSVKVLILPESFKDRALEKLLIPAFLSADLEFTYDNMQIITSIQIRDQVEGNVYDHYRVYVIVQAATGAKGIEHILKQDNVKSLEDLKFFTKLEYLLLESAIIDGSVDCAVLKSMPALKEAVVNNESLK